MAESGKARVVGFNHVALEVGDIEEALAFYGRLFDFDSARQERRHGLHRSRRSVHRPAERAASRRPTMAAISAWWSTTRRRRARR